MSPAEDLSGDHYQVLGIGRHASEVEIAKSYKRLALVYHPDKNRDDTERAEENFKVITEAYEVLRDAEKRRSYDLLSQVGGFGPGCPGYGGAEKEQPQPSSGNFGGGGLFDTGSDDVFTSFFGHADPFAGFFPAPQARSGLSRCASAAGPTAQPSARRSATAPSSCGLSAGYGGGLPDSDLLGGGLFGGSGGSFTAPCVESFRAARPRTGEGRPDSCATSRPLSAGIGSWPQSGGSTGSSCSRSCQPSFTVPQGTAVVVHASDKHPEHDGKAGRVLSWDTATGLYEVELESRIKIRLPRRSILQKCRVEITDLLSRKDVNGRLGDIFGCDDRTGRYTVLIKTGVLPVTLGLHCGNCILKIGTRVVVQGLEKDKDLNGSLAHVVSVDRRSSRYTVECQDGKQLKVKYGNVRC